MKTKRQIEKELERLNTIETYDAFVLSLALEWVLEYD